MIALEEKQMFRFVSNGAPKAPPRLRTYVERNEFTKKQRQRKKREDGGGAGGRGRGVRVFDSSQLLSGAVLVLG